MNFSWIRNKTRELRDGVANIRSGPLYNIQQGTNHCSINSTVIRNRSRGLRRTSETFTKWKINTIAIRQTKAIQVRKNVMTLRKSNISFWLVNNYLIAKINVHKVWRLHIKYFFKRLTKSSLNVLQSLSPAHHHVNLFCFCSFKLLNLFIYIVTLLMFRILTGLISGGLINSTW